MRPLLQTLRTVAFALLVPAGAAHALPYTNLYVFGDSLSDSGRGYALANTANPALFSGEQWIPSAFGFAQRFSNGPTAAEGLATLLGVTATPFGQPGGTNYAVGGATTGVGNFNFIAGRPTGIQSAPALQNTGLFSQVMQYVAAPAADAGTSLFLVQGGANDFFLASPTLTSLAAIQSLAQTAASNVAASILALALFGGAQDFLVPNLPNIAATPLFAGNALSGAPAPGAAAAAQAYSLFYNGFLAASLAAVDAMLPGVDIIAFDTFGAFNQILANPAAFGFDPATSGTSCLFDTFAGATAVGQCNGYLFWDDVHPTAALHSAVAAQYYAAVPAPGSVALIAIGLLAFAAFARRGATRSSALSRA